MRAGTALFDGRARGCSGSGGRCTRTLSRWSTSTRTRELVGKNSSHPSQKRSQALHASETSLSFPGLSDPDKASTSNITSDGEQKTPNHIAVIMDGNYRWALERGKRGEEGHEAGIVALRKLIECSLALGVRAVTVYAFSADNWKRGEGERNFIFNLFEVCLQTEIANLLENGVRIQFIGNRKALSKGLQQLMKRAEALTKGNNGLYLTVAINYSAREDIVAATQAIAEQVQAKELGISEINEEAIEKRLSTNIIPEQFRQPDLMLRTSGEERLSDFLLWELAYTELCFTRVKWPDFDEETFKEMVALYSNRNRRYGGR